MFDNEYKNISPSVLIVSVVPQGKGELVIKAAKAANTVGEFVVYGEGTASDKIWERLSITKHREVVICVTLFNKINEVMKAIADSFDRKKKNNGIIFAVSIDKHLSKDLFAHIMKKVKPVNDMIPDLEFEDIDKIRKKVENIMNNISKDKKNAEDECGSQLIIVRMARGYGQEIMDCAKKAGAAGGTILHGRSSTDSSNIKFFNIIIEPESDILFMLVSKESTDDILTAISEQYGPLTPAHALGFVVPVLKTLKITEDTP